MFLDGGVMWLVGLPIAYLSILVFGIESYALLFIIIQVEQLARLLIGLVRYKQGKWLKDLTAETKTVS